MPRLLARRRLLLAADAGARTATRSVHGAGAGRRAGADVAGRPAARGSPTGSTCASSRCTRCRSCASRWSSATAPPPTRRANPAWPASPRRCSTKARAADRRSRSRMRPRFWARRSRRAVPTTRRLSRVGVPVARIEPALALLADVALRPTFPAADLERLRTELLTNMLQTRDNPAAIASLAFPRLLYGTTHRYGTAENGTPESVKALTADDLRAFHQAQYRPDAAQLIVVGDVTSDGGARRCSNARSAAGARQGTAPAPRPCPTAASRRRAAWCWSTSRAPRSRRFASDGSACREARRTFSR